MKDLGGGGGGDNGPSEFSANELRKNIFQNITSFLFLFQKL
jgi:hypothetical protein